MRQPPPAVTTRGEPINPAPSLPLRPNRGRVRLRLLGGLILAAGLLGCTGNASPSPSPTPITLALLTPLTGAPTPVATIESGVPLTIQQRVAIFQQVWELVRDKYVYPYYHGLDWQAMHLEYLPKIEFENDNHAFYDLLKEMIDRLNDHHSWFANPDDAVWLDTHQQTKGNDLTGGVGLFGAILDEAFRVREVIPGSPADQAGVRRSDILQVVDDTPILSEGDADYLLRGLPGTTTTLLIQTPGQEARKVVVTRADVEYTLQAQATIWPGTHIAYLDLPTFNQDGIADTVDDQLTRLGKGQVDGLIIDLRENGGGLVREMNAALALFINGGQIGYNAHRSSRAEIWLESGNTLPALKGKPTVILIDPHSESASEVFTAVMRYRGAGIALGTPSAGNVETVYPHPLPGGSRLYLAEGRFVLPDGSSIEDIGVQPDIVLDTPWYEHAPAADPQVLAAIQYIQHHH